MNITYHKATINDKQLLIDYRLEFIVSLMGDQPQEAIDALKISLNTYFSYALENNSYLSYLIKKLLENKSANEVFL